MKLFDSDESDKDESVKESIGKYYEKQSFTTSLLCALEKIFSIVDIEINPLFEGVSGRDRLNLQKKFRGDERFKLTEDFVSDEEDKQKDVGKIDDDEITKSLKEERTNQFDILKEMFGDDMKLEQLNLKKYINIFAFAF